MNHVSWSRPAWDPLAGATVWTGILRCHGCPPGACRHRSSGPECESRWRRTGRGPGHRIVDLFERAGRGLRGGRQGRSSPGGAGSSPEAEPRQIGIRTAVRRRTWRPVSLVSSPDASPARRGVPGPAIGVPLLIVRACESKLTRLSPAEPTSGLAARSVQPVGQWRAVRIVRSPMSLPEELAHPEQSRRATADGRQQPGPRWPPLRWPPCRTGQSPASRSREVAPRPRGDRRPKAVRGGRGRRLRSLGHRAAPSRGR